MFRGFYTASTGMIAQQRRTEMLSNNIANANTPGYKADQSTIRSFPNMLMSSIQSGSTPNGTQQIGDLGTGVYMQEILPNFLQGSIVETENSTDMALLDGDLPVNPDTGQQGSVFFKVQTADNRQAYTRNGNFTIDGQGFLTTARGEYVLDENNNRIALQNNDFTLKSTGEITVDGQQVARLGVAYSDQPDALEKQENGLYFTANDQNLPNAYNADGVSFTMQQGFTESSNVDSSQAMTSMLEAYRVFEANQKVVQAYDRSMDKAVNDIGKV